MAILYGLGKFDFLTDGLSPERLLPVEPMQFELTGESDNVTSQKYVDGRLVTAGAALSSETYTLSIGIQAVNWLALQFAFGELTGTTASIDLPEPKFATIPATTPYEITDADIATSDVFVSTVDGSSYFTKVSTAPAAAGQFQVTLTPAKKLIFHSSDAGKPIAYRILKNYTNLKSIGQETVYTTLADFAFSGVAYGDEGKYKIVIPKMSRAGIPSLSVSEATQLDIEFTLAVKPGERRPFKLFELPTNYS